MLLNFAPKCPSRPCGLAPSPLAEFCATPLLHRFLEFSKSDSVCQGKKKEAVCVQSGHKFLSDSYLHDNEETETNTRADDGAIHADPEEVRLDLVVDEVI